MTEIVENIINLTTTGKVEDSILFTPGETEKTEEHETHVFYYFFFTATSINYMSSTMVLSYESHTGWAPEAWLAICTHSQNREKYAIKVKVPKFSSESEEVEQRAISVTGKMQTNSESIKSNYSISITAKGCPEPEVFRLLYTTKIDDSENYIANTEPKINFNVEYLVNKNISTFTGIDDVGHDRKEATMFNVVSRMVWGDRDADWNSYDMSQSGNYTERNYTVCNGALRNAMIYDKTKKEIVPSGFFKTTGAQLINLGYQHEHIYNGNPGGKFTFNEPLEVIGYHTFFFGKHFNNATSLPALGSDIGHYIEYKDKRNEWKYFNNRIIASPDGKLNCEPATDWETSNNQIDCYFVGEFDNLTSIKTGKHLRIIGNQAFKCQSNLSEIDLEGSPLERIGMYAFEKCSKLKTFDIPETLKLIGEGAFKNSGINEVTIPSELKYIEAETFRNCKGLKSVDFASQSSLIKICSNAFMGCDNELFATIEFPSSLKQIERMAFAECTNLGVIRFNDGLEYIGYRAFDKCNGISDLTIPAETIGERAFEKCENLKSVTIKSTVKNIRKLAFYNTNLLYIIVPDGVTSIGENAFEGTDYLIYNGNLPGAPWGAKHVAPAIDDGSIVYSDIDKTNILKCIDDSAMSTGMRDGVLTIGEYAFSDCTGIDFLSIPDSVTEIGEGAFYGCSNLTRIEITNNVETIGVSAFKSCASLSSFEFPSGIDVIEESVLKNCSSIISIFIPESVEEIKDEAFRGCSSLELIIYNGTKAQWENDIQKGNNWRTGTPVTAKVQCTDETIMLNS